MVNKYEQPIFLWEILVPTHFNNGRQIKIGHHQRWDKFVQKITGGLTIQKTIKGKWLDPNNQLFAEHMIPVKIACTSFDIVKISDFTAKHYKQKAVMYYQVSQEIIIKNYENEK